MRVVTTTNTRESMLTGMKLVADTVKVTAGPKGRNVAIDNGGVPVFTNDGVTVVREIFAENKIENIGVSMIKEACEKTNKIAGDGTTSTAILTHAIAHEGLKYIQDGTNPFQLSKALQEVGQYIIKIVKSQGKALTTKEEVQQVATISSQDEEIGQLIADIMDEVGNDGTITVEDGQTSATTHEIRKGLQFDTGYISPYMANKPDNTYTITNVPVLVTDHRIEKFSQIKPILEQLMKAGKKDLVIICDDIVEEALASVNLNKIKGVFNCVAIKAPGFGQLKEELLKDIAIVTGAKFVTHSTGDQIEQVGVAMLGNGSFKSTQTSTILTDGLGPQEQIQERVEHIRTQLEQSTGYEHTKHQERISKLTGGVAIIRVGAPSEMEAKNKKFKIEDALNATKSAIEEGIVDGGGNALANVRLPAKPEEENLRSEYYEIAKAILSEAIKYPYQNIIMNAGYDPDKVAKEQPIGMGRDSNIGLYVNMIDQGIIDPIKVIRVSLENAISSATMLLTTDATITDVSDRHRET